MDGYLRWESDHPVCAWPRLVYDASGEQATYHLIERCARQAQGAGEIHIGQLTLLPFQLGYGCLDSLEVANISTSDGCSFGDNEGSLLPPFPFCEAPNGNGELLGRISGKINLGPGDLDLGPATDTIYPSMGKIHSLHGAASGADQYAIHLIFNEY